MRIWALWVCVMTAAVLSAVMAAGSLESADLAWLLVQESPSSQPEAGAQVSVRRITPKSVFLAPTFTSCSEGYRQDALGRCVKVVKVNPSAQWDFFLHKLNSMYGPPPEPNTKPNPGPFRLPIPLATEPPSPPPPPPTTTTTTTSTTARPTTTTELPVPSTITEPPTVSTTTSFSTTTDDQTTTDVPFLIVVANTTEPPATSTITEPTTTALSTTTTAAYDPSFSDTTTTECNDCDIQTTMTTTTPGTIFPSRTTIVFPEDNHPKRHSSPIIRFPESTQQQQQQQQQPPQPQQEHHSPYWWPHSWEHRLWQPQQTYYQPRQPVYHGHREARPAWQH